MKFTAKIENIEARGYEEKTSKTTGQPYLLVRFEDEAGRVLEFADRDPARKDYYKRGTVGDLLIDIDNGRTWTNFNVRSWTVKAD